MDDKKIIHDGVSIKIFEAENPDEVVIRFTDDITAYNKVKQAKIQNKGIYCNGISCMVSRYLQAHGVATHYLEQISDTEQRCVRVDAIPLEFIARNVVAGSLAERLGLEVGMIPSEPIYDLCYKCDELNDPLINDSHAVILGLATKSELAESYEALRKINLLLIDFFKAAGITLVDFKIEFGRLPDGTLVMADDITPDNARLWDAESGESLDKDRFRHDDGNVRYTYRNVYERLKAVEDAQ